VTQHEELLNLQTLHATCCGYMSETREVQTNWA